MGEFNYKDKTAPKLTDEFKQKFVVIIQGKVETIKVDGLIAFAHEKGIKSMETDVIQYPNQDNQWTCIAQTTVIGYDWNPVTEKVEEVIYKDIADASPTNCTAMTKNSYIRMASTRSVGRTLRKYTNINMVTAEEISNSIDEHIPPEPEINQQSLETIKTLLMQKHLTQQDFAKVMFQEFNHTNYMGLTQTQGNKLISILQAYQKVEPEQAVQTSTPKTQG